MKNSTFDKLKNEPKQKQAFWNLKILSHKSAKNGFSNHPKLAKLKHKLLTTDGVVHA